jgi:phenylpyruvate tautomerase PptA (4-oxalocrotonate tautomerase family)
MKKFLYFFAVLLFVSCQFNGTNYNEESAKADAEKVTEVLYTDIAKKDFKEAETLFSDQFFKVTRKEDLQKIFTTVSEKLGAYKSRKLVNWQTTATVGTNSSTTYVLVYEVEYENYKATEKIALTKEKDSIKILGYNVNSDGFFK